MTYRKVQTAMERTCDTPLTFDLQLIQKLLSGFDTFVDCARELVQ
jgi:hypothetical protein